MKKIEIADLYDQDYSVTVINTLKQYWKKYTQFSCIGHPKRYHMLLLLDGCKGVYRSQGRDPIYVDDGTIVYTPAGSEYSVEFYDFKNESSKTVHINFLLQDSENDPFVLSKDILLFSADNANYKSLFYKMDSYSQATVLCYSKIKSIMYDLLFKLSEFYHKDYCSKYNSIAAGIEYLEQDTDQKLSIGEIAKMCYVSEVYFRKMFKEFSGMSPIDYRTHSKICRAKNYLKYEELSISEISDLLNFSDVSYFIKLFRKNTGMSPKVYRKMLKENAHDEPRNTEPIDFMDPPSPSNGKASNCLPV